MYTLKRWIVSVLNHKQETTFGADSSDSHEKLKQFFKSNRALVKFKIVWLLKKQKLLVLFYKQSSQQGFMSKNPNTNDDWYAMRKGDMLSEKTKATS